MTEYYAPLTQIEENLTSTFLGREVHITLIYPKNISKKVGLNKCRLYVSGNNLMTFTKYSGFDPEIGGGSFGVDRGLYPQARFYLGGVQVAF